MTAASHSSPGLVGRRAPDFEVACTTPVEHPTSTARLSDYQDRWLILVFYPQDFSLICPTELTALSDRCEEFAAHSADILAISTDSVESHERWMNTDRSRGGLGPVRIPLGSDPDGAVARAYHIYAESQHVAFRGLFIIDPNSVVQYQVVHNLNTGRRTDEVLRVLNALQMGGLCGESWTPGEKVIDPTRAIRPGTVISHFRIKQLLGSGGFATVYRAFDTQLERDVALKILKQIDDHPTRIRAEARAAAALNHPNVGTIYAIDDRDGLPLIVMEYLDGRPLTALIAEGPTPPNQVAKIAQQVAAGMAAAHDAGVVHGDLKPANIMLLGNGTVKVLDFGLSRRPTIPRDRDSTVSVGGNRSAQLAGTPSYMSPEQADGSAAMIASDVFSFGLVLFELLTGRRAVHGDGHLAVLNAIRSLDVEKVASNVEEPFGSLLLRMLAHDPAARITMAQVRRTIVNVDSMAD